MPLGVPTAVGLDAHDEASVIGRVLRSPSVPVDPHRNLRCGVRSNMLRERCPVELPADRPGHVLSHGEWLAAEGLHLVGVNPDERFHAGIMPGGSSRRAHIGMTERIAAAP